MVYGLLKHPFVANFTYDFPYVSLSVEQSACEVHTSTLDLPMASMRHSPLFFADSLHMTSVTHSFCVYSSS